MNFEEKWIKWEPIPNLKRKYYIDSIIDDLEGFRVELSDHNKNKVKVIFEDSIDAHRSTDESFRLKIIYELDQKYGADFYGDWTFFKVENSDYLRWLSDQSYKISEERDFIHFSFIASDSILDIVTNYEPKVEFID